MGLFTNKCVNPVCDHRVRKGSKFCPLCGTGAPMGLSTCGGCGKEVGATSTFCWNCGKELAAVAGPQFTSNRWDRSVDDFAVRIDRVDIKSWLVKPLIIEAGTRALLFQNGALAGDLAPGRYDMGGFAGRFPAFVSENDASVVVMDGGDVSVDLENDDLWTSDTVEVGACARLVLRVVDPEATFVNLIRERSRVTLDDIARQLAGEVHSLLTGIVAQCRAEELFTRGDIREQMEGRLRSQVEVTCGRFGMAVVQLRFISFAGEAYEQWRRGKAILNADEKEADLTTQRVKLNQRLREVLTQDKMDEFKSEKDFANFVRQTEHQEKLGEVINDDEMVRLKARFRFDRRRERVLRCIELGAIRDDVRRKKAWEDLLAQEDREDEGTRRDLERLLKKAKTAADIRRIELEIERLEHAEQERRAEWALVQLEIVKAMEAEEELREAQIWMQKLEARSKATAEALISITDGPAADHIMRLEELRRKENLSPEQLLALAAETSPSAAEALAEHYKVQGRMSDEVKAQYESRLTAQREITEGYADRVEKLTKIALEQLGSVGRAHPGGSCGQTVITTGGPCGPVVITGGSCGHCHTKLDGGGKFCPECGQPR